MACENCEIPNAGNAATGSDLVCYCFNHTADDFKADFQAHGASTIEASIRAAVKAGDCNCEALNPKGSCCLGDVRAVYQGLAAAP